MALSTEKQDNIELDLPQTDPTLARRKLLQWGIYAIGGAVTLAIGVPVVLYALEPALESASSGESLVELGNLSDFANQTAPKSITKSYKYTDSFKQIEGNKTVFVRALKAGASESKDFQILDSTCTHAGCAVSYNSPIAPTSAKDKFYCPCHSSIYAVDGKNEAVAPRPLHSYKVYVKDGKVAFNVFEATA